MIFESAVAPITVYKSLESAAIATVHVIISFQGKYANNVSKK